MQWQGNDAGSLGCLGCNFTSMLNNRVQSVCLYPEMCSEANVICGGCSHWMAREYSTSNKNRAYITWSVGQSCLRAASGAGLRHYTPL